MVNNVGSLLRFSFVGVLVTATHVVMAFCLIVFLDWSPVGANALAFLAANVCSFVANSFWTFEVQPNLDNFGRFLLLSSAGFTLTTVIAAGVDFVGLPAWLGVMLVGTVLPALSYLGHRYFSFRHSD